MFAFAKSNPVAIQVLFIRHILFDMALNLMDGVEDIEGLQH